MATTASEAGAFGGRGKRRGERVTWTVRIPADLKLALDAAARESGLPLTDYVTLALGRKLGLDDPDYIRIPEGHAPDELELGLPDRREARRLSA